jgi:hypothetical protein
LFFPVFFRCYFLVRNRPGDPNEEKAPVLLGLMALVASSLVSCSEPREASMTNLRLTSDSEGAVPTLTYSPTDDIYAFCDLTDASSRTQVEVKIRALTFEGILPDAVIVESGYGVFSTRYFTGPYEVTLAYRPA